MYEKRHRGIKTGIKLKEWFYMCVQSPVSILSSSNMRNIKDTNEAKPITTHGEATWT